MGQERGPEILGLIKKEIPKFGSSSRTPTLFAPWVLSSALHSLSQCTVSFATAFCLVSRRAAGCKLSGGGVWLVGQMADLYALSHEAVHGVAEAKELYPGKDNSTAILLQVGDCGGLGVVGGASGGIAGEAVAGHWPAWLRSPMCSLRQDELARDIARSNSTYRFCSMTLHSRIAPGNGELSYRSSRGSHYIYEGLRAAIDLWMLKKIMEMRSLEQLIIIIHL